MWFTYLGVVSAALFPKGHQKKLQARVPKRQRCLVIHLITAREKLQLYVTDLDHLRLLPDAHDLLTRLLRRRPQWQPEVGIVREQCSGLLRHFHRPQMRRSAWLHYQAYGSVVEHLCLFSRRKKNRNKPSKFPKKKKIKKSKSMQTDVNQRTADEY